MNLRADATIPFSPEAVFCAYRDELTKLAPYLPNVRSIEVKARKEAGDRVEIINEWRGGGDVPAALRALIDDSMLGWTDRATWDAAARHCEWRIETRAFSEAIQCRGHNEFLASGDGTLLQVRGEIVVDAKKIRGVPGFLAGTLGRTLEEFLATRIEANLVETGKGLARYLADRGRSAPV